MRQTWIITVSGQVQGVFFRQSTKEKANALGINGTVQNNRDDTVTIVATGEPDQLEELHAWCRKGPPKARVADVVVKEVPVQEFERFTILRS